MKVQLPKAAAVFFAITITVLAFLSINNYFRGSTKDYAKWFFIGETVLKGGDIYAPRGDGTFQFMYPPTAAVLFAIPSYFGELPLIIILDRKSTRLNSSHSQISYAVFCLKKK